MAQTMSYTEDGGPMAVPMAFTVEEMVAHFTGGAVYPTADDIETAGCRVGRNAYPALVSTLWSEGLLLPEVAAVTVPSAWSMAEFPNVQLDEDEWSTLFDFAGYTVDSRPSARPTQTLTLWRGAVPECRSGWAWTDDIDLARWFAQRPFTKGRGRVYVAEVEPARLLARITDHRPGESEYVVDTRGLHVEELTDGVSR